MENHNIEIITLTSSNADSFLVKFNGKSKDYYVLVDGGLKGDGENTLEVLNNIFHRNEVIDFVILTHVDLDHINGLLALFSNDIVNSDTIRGVIFNFPHNEEEMRIIKNSQTQCGYKDGNRLLELLIKKEIIVHHALQGDQFYIDDEVSIKILSPTQSALDIDHKKWRDTNIGHDENDDYDKTELLKEKHIEDTKPQNVSSISCLMVFDEKKLLFSGDTVPSQILSSVSEVTTVNFFKIPHHGSKYNISKILLEMFPSNLYLIPGSRGAYPNFYTIALIEDVNLSSRVYVPKGSWVHSDRYKKIINLSFAEYEVGTRILL